ncbi:MAG: type II secretion system F family protein [Sulfitobacter sp.]
MARFRYKGFDAEGNADDGWIEGRDTIEAFAMLQSRGIVVFELKDAAAGSDQTVPWYAREISFGNKGYSLSDQAAFSELLGRLAELNLPLTEMLRILVANSQNGAMRQHVQRTATRVMDGEDLAQAFGASGTGFSGMFLQILRIAFVANTLPKSMQDLAGYLRRADETRSQVATSLIYPGILILAVFALLGVVSGFLAPALAPMFASLDRPVPAGLAFFLGLSNVFGQHWQMMILACGVLGAAVFLFFGSAFGKQRLAQVFWRIPFIGPINRDALLLRHAAALDILLRSGMPLAEALDAAADLGAASPFEDTFTAAAAELRSGRRASDIFKQDTLLPTIFVDLFAVGEEANKLSGTLQTLVNILDQSLRRRIQKSLQLLTPTLTIVLGGVIGVLVYSVMGAILDINTVAF